MIDRTRVRDHGVDKAALLYDCVTEWPAATSRTAELMGR